MMLGASLLMFMSVTAPPASFALVIGINESVEADLPALHYADDDAARYFELFRMAGARTWLLTDLDDDTRRVHPEVHTSAAPPNRRALERAVDEMAREVTRARDAGRETSFIFAYAGHGNMKGGKGYITLADARLSGEDLVAQVIDRVGATRSHLLVDACYSYYLAYGRGPGGTHRSLAGFSLPALARRDDVGLLLSTSAARESHEWEAFQAGVFSHELRSGILGAADANLDGAVSYREIAAFVEQANAAVPNERFRPRLLARPPARDDTLLDLHDGLARRLEVDGDHPGHYVLEDARGVRLADFHGASGQVLHVMLPAAPLYLRQLGQETEYVLPMSVPTVRLTALAPTQPRVAQRGAAHDAFSRLFTLPFGAAQVEHYTFADATTLAEPEPLSATQVGMWSAAAVGVAALGSGAYFSYRAVQVRNGTPRSASQERAATRNERIDSYNRMAVGAYVVSGLGAATAGLLYGLLASDDDE